MRALLDDGRRTTIRRPFFFCDDARHLHKHAKGLAKFWILMLIRHLPNVSSIVRNPVWRTIGSICHYGNRRLPNLIRRSRFIVLEKRHGRQAHGSTEAGIERRTTADAVPQSTRRNLNHCCQTACLDASGEWRQTAIRCGAAAGDSLR